MTCSSQLVVRAGALETLTGVQLVRAESGEDWAGYRGGDYAFNHTIRGGGGTDSGNGLPDGLGFDLASINIQSFELRPGAGGEVPEDCCYAGGGGGVLVDGDGPQYSAKEGQGYGGGQGGFHFYDPWGSAGQGVVLIEINSKQ